MSGPGVPSLRLHCGYCHRDSQAPVTVVSNTAADHCELYTWSERRQTCHHCGLINQTPLSVDVADLLVDAGCDHHIIYPPYEARPDLGPWTLDHIAQAECLEWVHHELIWEELDRDGAL